jgi:lysophospholipase L1-like esterase
VKAIVFSILPVAILVVSGEVALRAWAYHFRTPYERYNYGRGRLELVPNIQVTTAGGHEFRINSKGFLGPEWTDVKPEGVYRIFALGDSCTFADGHWRRAYPAMLEESLNAVDPGITFQVINAGIEGYNSEYALDRVRTELLSYEPDMVLTYVGWNDLMKVNPNSAAASGKHAWLARSMERSYLLKGYKKLLFFYLRPLIMNPEPGGEADLHAFDQFVPLRFQANLESIVESLRARHVQPVLLTLPTVVEPGMNAEELKRRHVVFPYYAGSYSVGRFLSLHGAYNRVIRNTALKYDAPLIDMDKVFNSYDKRDLFWDTMHPSHKGHAVIAKSILEALMTLRLRPDVRAARQ